MIVLKTAAPEVSSSTQMAYEYLQNARNAAQPCEKVCRLHCFLTFNQVVFCIENLLCTVEVAYVYDLGTQKPSPGVQGSLDKTDTEQKRGRQREDERATCCAFSTYRCYQVWRCEHVRPQRVLWR